MAQQGVKEKLKARKKATEQAQTASKPRAAGAASLSAPARSVTAEQVAKMVKPRSQVMREAISAREAKGGGRQIALRRELLIESAKERMKKRRSTGRSTGRR